MRSLLVVLTLTFACSKKTEKTDRVDPAPVAAAGDAAPADAAGLPPATLDDSVTVLDEEPCTDDCEKKCAAKQLSACIRPAMKLAAKNEFEASCNAGYPMGCENMEIRAPAHAAEWDAKEKAAQAALEAACDAKDAWACYYARIANPHKPFYDKACELGLARACVDAAGRKVGPGSAEKGRHFALMFGRACKERKDPRQCGMGARFAAEVGDTSGAEALRKRGLEIASAGCSGDGDAAVVACAWQRSLAQALGDKAGADKAFARAVELADKACKAGSLPSCRMGAGLYAGLYAVVGTPLDDMQAPERPTNLELGKPFLSEACRLAWRASPKAEPKECTEAANQGIDTAPLKSRR